MRDKAMLMAMMSALMMDPINDHSGRGRRYQPDDTPVKKVIPKGLKEFYINGHTVYALNYKNALKKAKKLNTSAY